MRAILVRRRELRETSLRLVWLTREEGEVETQARGIRREGKSASLPDLFGVYLILVSRSQRTSLHTLREYQLVEDHSGLQRSYTSLQLAAYFVELCHQVSPPGVAQPEVYDLLENALGFLSAGGESSVRVMERFELRLAEKLGVVCKNDTRFATEALVEAGVTFPRLRSVFINSERSERPPGPIKR
ncbi:MAG: DNA repair protein RecO [Verrucomicrobiia bacterium]